MPVAIPEAVLQIDGAILLFIQNNLRSPALTQFFKAVSNYGVIVMAAYFVILLLWERRKLFPIASACVVSGLLGNFSKDYLKHLVKRPRPFLDIPALEPLIKRPKGYSFPSGHTCAAFGLAVSWSRVMRSGKVSVIVFLMAVLMGFSRLYVAVHNPSDVIVGALCGVLSATISIYILTAWDNRKKTMSEGEK